jgi:hypothetical protein
MRVRNRINAMRPGRSLPRDPSQHNSQHPCNAPNLLPGLNPCRETNRRQDPSRHNGQHPCNAPNLLPGANPCREPNQRQDPNRHNGQHPCNAPNLLPGLNQLRVLKGLPVQHQKRGLHLLRTHPSHRARKKKKNANLDAE